jgi:hypothetical protein
MQQKKKKHPNNNHAMPEKTTGKQEQNEHGHSRRKKKQRSSEPAAANISGIEIRMLPPFVRDNRQLKIWPFPGYAKLYCLTTVVSDMNNELTGAMDLSAFARVGKNDYLPLNKTIYYWHKNAGGQPLPENVHIMCAIIKSREAIKDPERVLAAVKKDSDYRRIVDHLNAVVADTASFAVVTNMTVKIANIITKHLGKTADMPVAMVVDSFSRLHGDWDKPGIRQVSMSAKNADFGFEVIVHDHNPFSTVRTIQGIPLFDVPSEGSNTMTPM